MEPVIIDKIAGVDDPFDNARWLAMEVRDASRENKPIIVHTKYKREYIAAFGGPWALYVMGLATVEEV